MLATKTPTWFQQRSVEWDLSALLESKLLPRHDAAALAVLREMRSAGLVV
jgi:hypothetical protein